MNLSSKIVVGLANAFSLQHDGCVQISPMGDFPHPLGLQRVDSEACRKMEAGFNQNARTLGNRFVGLPWYIGHPDLDRKTYPNDACYGRIKQLQARPDGLYSQIEWGKKGKALIEDGDYAYHSPVWDGNAIGIAVDGKPVVRPFQLRSVGFTNQPRIPTMPLANSEVGVVDAWMHGADTGTLLAPSGAQARGELVRQLVQKKMAESGLNYSSAWAAVERENPTLFAAMQRSPTPGALANARGPSRIMADEKQRRSMALEMVDARTAAGQDYSSAFQAVMQSNPELFSQR
jgi:hypothetical protein